MTLTRSIGRAAAVLGLLLALPGGARAADYPNRPIRLIVPYAAGGPTDQLGRAVAEFLQKDLKQSVVVENKGGAQGSIGAESAARAEPDGYTLFCAAGSIVVINPMLYKKLTYDPARDFRMMSLVVEVPVVMEVNPAVPAKTVKEFIAWAKANPGKAFYGSSGTGGSLHLAGEMFAQMTGVPMTHVPYKGAAPALTDLLSGQVNVMFDTVSTSVQHIESGGVRALGVSSEQRIPQLPNVPTIAESGLDGYRVSVWYGIAAPTRTPDDVAQVITASLDRAMGDPAFRASLEKIGFVVFNPRTPAEIAAFVEQERARWAKVIKTQNISLD
jgi:tripartite-type tricarboxylate transporter receptor subunit TctC